MKYSLVSLLFVFIVFGCKSNDSHSLNYENKISGSETNVKSASESRIPIDKKTDVQSISPKSKKMAQITIKEVMGQFDPSKHADFVIIDSKYADRDDRLMYRNAYEAFQNMWNAAESDGVELKIISATRNFDYQKGIWERKWNGQTKVEGRALPEWIPDPLVRAKKILEYSSMPGTSRHHWGTDIDLNAFENSYFEKGEGLKEYEWLQKNAGTHGFCQPYTAKGAERPTGYYEEKWHWSYIPSAMIFLERAKELNDRMISGFAGSETAEEISVVEKYIFGINHRCKE